ncbi:MAG TPA: response regulator transcription factor [Puia sp.]|jgi:DNA-binding NarL/FixJ family response regulator|nr:response regulator transcription factor [Puia sp.]
MIRILLADDFTIIRKGVRQILTQAYPTAQIEEVEEGEEWVDKLRDRTWDMVISDLPGPDDGGYHVLQRIREDFPALPVLILSLYTKEYHAFRALQAGASGYVSTDAAPEELLWAVRQILAGKKYIAIPRDN